MVSQLWVFVAGVLVSQQLPSLPSALPCSIALVGAAIAARTRLCWASIFIVGVMYGVARGHFALEHQLPEVLEGTEVRLVGTVVELPVSRRMVRFRQLVLCSPLSRFWVVLTRQIG